MAAILKQTDLSKVRDANMRIVNNRNKEFSPSDVSRASRIILQIAELERKQNPTSLLPRPQRIAAKQVELGPLLVGSLQEVRRLKVVG